MIDIYAELWKMFELLSLGKKAGRENRPQASYIGARVAEYVTDDNHDATPDEVLRECDLDESSRRLVDKRHYLAVIRFGIFGADQDENDTDGIRFHTVEWADVAEWDI